MSAVDPEALTARIEVLIAELEAVADVQLREKARAVVSAVLQLHAAGLARTLEIARPQAEALAADPLVGSLLMLHGLHPVDLEQRVQSALDRVRPMVSELLLVKLEQGRAHIRLKRLRTSAVSTEVKVRAALEDALGEHAADLSGIEIEDLTAPADFVPLEELARGEQRK